MLAPATVAPYFILVALIHLASVWTRFDLVAAKLPHGMAEALMLGQFPLILLSGYFEGRIDYGETMDSLPLWMRIKSKPVKLAFTFGFIYIACVSLQALNFSIGPIDPTPPLSFPPTQRALWFGMFTVGMFFPFYLAATGLLIPILRALTKPLRAAPTLVGGVVALALGAAIGVGVFALATKTKLPDFIAGIKNTINNDPVLAISVTLGMTFGPMLIGFVLGKKEE
jgi:hypothetical protein